MILVIIYTGAGLYMVLMALGLLHRTFVGQMGPNRRNGLMILGFGFLILGIFYGFYYLNIDRSPKPETENSVTPGMNFPPANPDNSH